ncbi:hypothetical protein, partial [Vibrio cholerae]|uniref:hypothetical protein n=1 Tax=Vibrio cholerae TaxID=666 RepID=UPI0021CB9F23
ERKTAGSGDRNKPKRAIAITEIRRLNTILVIAQLKDGKKTAHGKPVGILPRLKYLKNWASQCYNSM